MTPSHIDSNGVCYELKVIADSSLDPSLIEALHKAKLHSFKAFPETGKVLINSKDFNNIPKYYADNIEEVVQITGRPVDQVTIEFAEYYQSLDFVIQPNGISGVIHKVINFGYVSGAAVQSVIATSTSHISGVTGMSLLGCTPALVVFVPLVGGVFFGSLERLAANTPVQPVLVLARDACLLTPRVVEIVYNNILIGPVLRMVGIDAPLNVTSMLKFGSGTRIIAGSLLNSTLEKLIAATPNLFKL